ncbi:MAG: hypothetical protein ACRC7O_16270, partial [Fimbriiglobus sp.]
MTRGMWALAAAVVAAAGAGCGGARYVTRGADEGVVAVPDRSNDWPSYHHDKATKLIHEHVGPDYEVVEEWSEKTGERVTQDQDVNREQTFNREIPFLPADKVTTKSTTTVADVTEWRIKYRKKSAGAAGGSVVAVGGTAPPPGAGSGVVQAGGTLSKPIPSAMSAPGG